MASSANSGVTNMYHLPDPEHLKSIASTMRQTLNQLGQTFETLEGQSTKVADISPPKDASAQIKNLRHEIRKQDAKQERRIFDVKNMVKEVLKDQIAEHMRSQIKEQIKTEISRQVEEQVRNQIPNFLPTNLHVQSHNSQKQLVEVRCSLVNAESRRANGMLRAQNLEEPLAVILKSDGEKSALYPRDLKTLFAQDGTQIRELIRDFGIEPHDTREQNLNRFMAHIGVSFHLIPVPILAGMTFA